MESIDRYTHIWVKILLFNSCTVNFVFEERLIFFWALKAGASALSFKARTE